MFGKVLCCGLILTLFACARPNYITSSNGTNPTPEEKPGVCSAKFSRQELCLSLVWDKMPTESATGSFRLKIWRANRGDGTPVTTDPDGAVDVVLWMPSMGHGSSPVTLTKLDVGTYLATNVFFIMHGEWQIKIQTKNGNEVKDEAVATLTF